MNPSKFAADLALMLTIATLPAHAEPPASAQAAADFVAEFGSA